MSILNLNGAYLTPEERSAELTNLYDGDGVNSADPTGTTNLGDMSRAEIGKAVGAVGKVGLGAAHSQGVGFFGDDVALGAISDMASGKSVAETGINAGKKTGQKALGLLGPVGELANIGIGIASEEDKAKAAAKALGSLVGSVSPVPFGAKIGSVLGGLAYDSFDEGYMGDAFGTRDRESARDRAEDRGWSVGQTSDAAAVDADRARSTSIDPGLGSSGYGLNPGLSDIDPYGGYSLGDMAASDFGGNGDSDSTGGIGSDGDAAGHSGSGAGMGPGL